MELDPGEYGYGEVKGLALTLPHAVTPRYDNTEHMEEVTMFCHYVMFFSFMFWRVEVLLLLYS
jgi:hypothetical protein